MIYSGACRCATWTLRITADESLSEFNPRVCDCDYCKAHPSAVIGNPTMQIELVGPQPSLAIDKHGDGLANFYRCNSCDELLAVGCEIDGTLRGAANALLLEQRSLLGSSVSIQPRLLRRDEKLQRWRRVWGKLSV